MPSLISKLGAQRVRTMSRKTNNELSLLPGFFFYPQDKTGLEELSYEDRCEICTNQGNYTLDLYMHVAKDAVIAHLDNCRVPTHRRPGTEIPGYGKVPFDLREVVQIK